LPFPTLACRVSPELANKIGKTKRLLARMSF
jgi:hypothetical protein